MTKVLVNLCWIVPGAVGGSEEYTTRLLRAVAATDADDVQVELAAPAELAEAHPELADRFATATFRGPAELRPYRVALESTWLRRRSGGADVVHHFGGRLPARRAGRTVLTIHDLQPLDLPANFSRTKRAYLGWALPRSARHADLVCTVSDWVAAGVVDRFGVDPARVRVVPSTWDAAIEPDAADPLVAGLGPGPVIVYPAATYPHKDHTTLIRAATRLAERHRQLQLVLLGGAGRAERDVARAVGEAGAAVRIVRPGRVAPSSVVSLLARADVLAFPSRYEGFGLPVLEAMRLGTAVVAADAAALPEVVADAGLLVAPAAVDAWVDALDAVIADAALRDRLVAAGRTRAQGFAPRRAAHRLLDAWRAVA